MTQEDRIEELRLILEAEQGVPVSFAEATKVAASLMKFYEALADGIDIIDGQDEELAEATSIPTEVAA